MGYKYTEITRRDLYFGRSHRKSFATQWLQQHSVLFICIHIHTLIYMLMSRDRLARRLYHVAELDYLASLVPDLENYGQEWVLSYRDASHFRDLVLHAPLIVRHLEVG